VNLNEFLTFVVKKGASDIHFKVGSPPLLRIYGDLVAVKGRPLSPRDTSALAFTFMSKSPKRRFSSFFEVDTTYTIPNVARFRVNIYRQRGNFSIAMRYIPLRIPSFEALNIPEVVKKLAMEPRGLVLVTGVTGSGKTTTLAAMINYINMHKRAHIITIEDPVEFIHKDIKSHIEEREVGLDTGSFVSALRSALRQDPDVIMIGEMRDRETIETALHAAETGHLVFSTFHTTNAVETINGIVGYFPPESAEQVLVQIAANLKGVIGQRLIKRKDGAGRILAAEVLVSTPTIRSCIITPERFNEIPTYMERGRSEYGMQTFDQAVLDLYRKGLISYQAALENASVPTEFERKLQFEE